LVPFVLVWMAEPENVLAELPRFKEPSYELRTHMHMGLAAIRPLGRSRATRIGPSNISQELKWLPIRLHPHAMP
jgi:hypothetical protein